MMRDKTGKSWNKVKKKGPREIKRESAVDAFQPFPATTIAEDQKNERRALRTAKTRDAKADQAHETDDNDDYWI